VPFSPAAKIIRVVPDAAAAFVPPALARAVLPDIAVLTREIQEPSRQLRDHGIEATVTFYGSARILSPEKARAQLDAVTAELGRHPKGKAARQKMDDAREALRMSRYYQVARDLGALIAREGGGKVAVVTGGGPGIMEGGNRGAFEAGGPSVGYNIKLPMEQGLNPYATRELEFTFDNFSTRKMALRHGSMGLVYFPGGFGTMDELFEVLTLIQTGKMPRTPIILIGEKSYWDKILNFDEFDHMGLISHADLSLFVYAENAQQAWSAIRAAHEANK
ncbi:MAG: TIGR00730 family Rossman fold protein, partial [Elusimicrobiota bacterium]